MNEVLDEVMAHAKDDMAVVVKTNMWDDCWRGSDIEEGIKIAKEIAKHKVHGIVLSGGTVSASPIGRPSENALSAKSTDTLSPRAQQNSSKSIGNIPTDSSSEGIVMFSTFFRMEISEPVSM